MTWRSRSLLVLSIAFLLLLPPEGAWTRGRGHERGHHHPSHHHFFGFGQPYGYAPCGLGSGMGANARPRLAAALRQRSTGRAGRPRRCRRRWNLNRLNDQTQKRRRGATGRHQARGGLVMTQMSR